MAPNQGGQASALTPRDLEEFEDLFIRWKDRFPNSDLLEGGGIGDLEDLAPAILEWAQGVLARVPEEVSGL